MKRLVLIAALTACAGSPNYWNAYTPVRAQTKLDRDSATQRAVIAITDAGREVESNDAGVILTKWFSGDGFGGGENRFRVRVIVSTGSYEVGALCQIKSPTTSAWGEGCDETKRPQFVLDTIAKIDAALRRGGH